MKSIACLLLAASAVHGLRLSAQEKVDLEAKLAAWKASQAGKQAEANGFLPPKTEHGNLEDGEIDDELVRFATTQKIVDDLNKQHSGAVFSTDNQFALMTEDEFAAFVKGSFKHETPKRQLRSDNVQLTLTQAQQEATDVDWTTNKCMSPVRDQGQCGSCWAFAAVGAAEAAHCLMTGSLVDFSEQQLVSCASSAGYGCQGGWPNKALDYISQTGLCTESGFPYASGRSKQNGSCHPACHKVPLVVGKTVVRSGEDMLQSVLDKQPVTVVVAADNDVWRNYKSGVVQYCPSAQSNHAVVAVGYGTTQDGQQHFKIKNSWGSQWGDSGYMYLKRGVGGKGTCNLAESLTFPEMIEPTTSQPWPTSTPQPTSTTRPTPTTQPPKTRHPSPKTRKPVPTPSLPVPTPSLPESTPSLPEPTSDQPEPTSNQPVPTPSLPEPTPSLPEPTSDQLEPTSNQPEPTSSLPEPTPSLPEPTSDQPEPTSNQPEPTSSLPEPASRFPRPTSNQPEPTSSLPEPASRFPRPTSNQPEPTSSLPEPASRFPRPTSRLPGPWPTRKPEPMMVSIEKSKEKPQGDCNGCNGCFDPAASRCLTADYDKEYCEYLTAEYGTKWCA